MENESKETLLLRIKALEAALADALRLLYGRGVETKLAS